MAVLQIAARQPGQATCEMIEERRLDQLSKSAPS
jgi:hypothetical protein